MQDKLTGEKEAMAVELSLRTAELEELRWECVHACEGGESAQRRIKSGHEELACLVQRLEEERAAHQEGVRVLIGEKEELRRQKAGIAATLRQDWSVQQMSLEEELRLERERVDEVSQQLLSMGDSEASAACLVQTLQR